MPGDTGPTAQEIEYLNAISSGQQADPSTGQVIQSGAPATDTGGQISAMRNQIAQTMMARPQGGFSGGGGGGGDLYAAMRASMASRAPQGDPYAAMRASMASRAPAGGGGGGDPYAAMRASMASRAQPAAGGGGPTAGMWYDPTTPTGGNPWKTGPERNFLAEAMAYQEANPYDQYFGSRGPISGSPGEVDWLQNLQPWQQGGTSGGETTYQSQGSIFPGYLGAGGALRADPNYWGYTGPGTGWGTDQNSRLLWEQLRQNNPFAFQQLGGQGGMDAGIAGGFGPGGGPGGGGGGGAGAGAGGGGGGVGGGSSAGPGGGGSSGGWGATGTGTIGGTAGGGFGAGATGVAGFGGAGGGYGNYGGFGGLGPAGPSSGAMGQVGVGLGIGTVGAPGTGIGEAFGPSSPGGWGAGAEGYSGYGAPGGFGGDTGEGFGGVW